MPPLAYSLQGEGSRFVWLHGFTQTRATAATFLSILAGDREVVTPDLPGHGENAALTRTLTHAADDVAGDFLAVPAALGGYSLGGRLALHVAIHHPPAVTKLVLASTSLGIADENLRCDRRVVDEARAQFVLQAGTDAFLEEWFAQPLFADLPPTLRGVRSRDAEGLAQSLLAMGVGSQPWLGDEARAVRAETLVLCGSRDERYRRASDELVEALPHAHLVVVPDAGHSVHLEQPAVCAAIIQDFLA